MDSIIFTAIIIVIGVSIYGWSFIFYTIVGAIGIFAVLMIGTMIAAFIRYWILPFFFKRFRNF